MLSGMKVLLAISKNAQKWVEENVIYENWQMVCAGGIAGDWRMMDIIEEAMLNEGLRKDKRWWEFWQKPDFAIL